MCWYDEALCQGDGAWDKKSNQSFDMDDLFVSDVENVGRSRKKVA
jgi:hypothetical protein